MESYESRVAQTLNGTETDQQIVDRLLALYKSENPSARGTTGLFRYTRNGSRKSVRTCYLCDLSTSWATQWPRTVQSYRAESEDTAHHVAEVRRLFAEHQQVQA